MGAMKELLIDEIEKLSEETGYSFEFLMDGWYEHGGGPLSWMVFTDDARAHKLVEPNPMADVLWMVTVSPDCKKPVVRCAELKEPYPFGVTIMTSDFSDLPELKDRALKQLDGLRRAAKGAAV